MQSTWKRYFQIGRGIVLLLGAPVESKFDGAVRVTPVAKHAATPRNNHFGAVIKRQSELYVLVTDQVCGFAFLGGVQASDHASVSGFRVLPATAAAAASPGVGSAASPQDNPV